MPDIGSENGGRRSQAERQAVNTVIQGSASEVIKLAMLAVERALLAWNKPHDGSGGGGGRSRPRLILQIHDELIYEVEDVAGPSNSADAALPGDGMRKGDALRRFVLLLKECMEIDSVAGVKLRVPLLVNVQVGERWDQLEPYSP